MSFIRLSGEIKLSDKPNPDGSSAMASASNLVDKKDHLLGLVDSIARMEHTPFPFLCAATMVEFISNLSGHGNSYDSFVCTYLPEQYRNFEYRAGEKDLPKQMSYLLRNGLVHNFSLVPRVTPMRKTKCKCCGFSALVTKSDFKKVGPPHCPQHAQS